jgi:uncharacterized protein YccT (UPF0319 family)
LACDACAGFDKKAASAAFFLYFPEVLMGLAKPAARWTLVVLFGVLVGCAAKGPIKTYEGPERAATELALVSVPEVIQVMAIDGREPPPNLLRSNSQLALLPGEHVLSLRYVQLFQISGDEHDVIRSRQAALRFTASAGASYKLEIPHQANRDQAREFAKNPQFRLVGGPDGSAIDSAPIKSYAEASLIDTIQKAFESQGEPQRPVTNLDLLKDVWGRTSPEERNAFRSWLEQQGK